MVLGELLIFIVAFYFLVYKNPSFFSLSSGGTTTTTTPAPSGGGNGGGTTTTTTPTPTPTTGGGTTTGPCTGPNWDCITHKERLTVKNCNATVTGTVIAAGDGGPHFAPDGDLVFSLKPDTQYANMLEAVNKSDKKYGGGLWCEGVCQQANKATEPRHQGDCKCTMTKFTTPKVGDHLKITGAHVIDNAEGGQAEIHPIYTMTPVTNTSSAALAHYLDTMAYAAQPRFGTVDYMKIRIGNLSR